MWLLSVWILLEPLYHKHVTVNCHFYQYEYGHSYYAHRFLILNSFTLFSWTDSDLMPGQLPAVCVCSSNRRRTRDQRESESVSVRPEAACHKVRLAVIICWSMCVCVCVTVSVVCGGEVSPMASAHSPRQMLNLHLPYTPKNMPVDHIQKQHVRLIVWTVLSQGSIPLFMCCKINHIQNPNSNSMATHYSKGFLHISQTSGPLICFMTDW